MGVPKPVDSWNTTDAAIHRRLGSFGGDKRIAPGGLWLVSVQD